MQVQIEERKKVREDRQLKINTHDREKVFRQIEKEKQMDIEDKNKIRNERNKYR